MIGIYVHIQIKIKWSEGHQHVYMLKVWTKNNKTYLLQGICAQ